MRSYIAGPALIPDTARPVVIRVTEFNEEAAAEFSQQMSKAHETGQPVIPVVIDSYGGDLYSLLSMAAEIENSRIPVVTVVEAKAMSCGAFLFTFGRERYVDREAVLMVHDGFSAPEGKTHEIVADAVEMQRGSDRIFQRASRNCGKPAGYLQKMLDEKKHADWYMSADDALKHGLATHIGVPELRTTISISMELIAPARAETRKKRVLTNRGKGSKVTTKRT